MEKERSLVRGVDVPSTFATSTNYDRENRNGEKQEQGAFSGRIRGKKAHKDGVLINPLVQARN